MYLSSLNAGDFVQHELAKDRRAWLQVLRGRVEVNGQVAEAGDGFAVSAEPLVGVVGRGAGEVMLFDMA